MATTEEEVQAPRGVNGAQVALLVGGLVLILALVWYFVLRGGGETAENAPPATTQGPQVAPEDEPQARSGEPERPQKQPVETFELFASKDPFEPLIDPTATAGGATTGGTATGGSGGSGDTSGATGDNSGGGETVGGHSVRLVDVFVDKGSPRAQVEVDGTVFTVSEGEVFAENFELMSASGECATMLFGDDQFTLCEGEEILK